MGVEHQHARPHLPGGDHVCVVGRDAHVLSDSRASCRLVLKMRRLAAARHDSQWRMLPEAAHRSRQSVLGVMSELTLP